MAIITRLLCQLAEDSWEERTYHWHDDPDSCDLGKFMVMTNTISGLEDVVALFYENKLGVDVDVCDC